MSAPVLDDLKSEVERTATVEASAVALINGIADRVKAAVDAALVNGATEAELQPVLDEVAALKAANSALSDAVVANT